MQKQFIKNIYQEFVYCDPNDHLLKPCNNLTRPERNYKSMCNSHKNNSNPSPQIITIQSDITGHYGNNNNPEINQTINLVTPPIEEIKNIQQQQKNDDKPIKKETKPFVYDEETFNQIELRGFITKDLLKQSLDKGSNLFHIAKEIFDELHDKYHEFKEILHTLTTEFDNTIQCVIETGKEITKKINHIIYQLYLAVMDKKL
mgnify:CR=1 FL=1